jgi:hypothetical protein
MLPRIWLAARARNYWRGGFLTPRWLPGCWSWVVVPARTVIWIVALAWMGVACILNARRCGRTHCRFTGPYYLVMIIPVLALGLRVVPAGLLGWLALGAFIILGGKTIWWATERAQGKFS